MAMTTNLPFQKLNTLLLIEDIHTVFQKTVEKYRIIAKYDFW